MEKGNHGRRGLLGRGASVKKRSEIPVVTFIGKSNSGKTTLLVKVIPELKRRGYKVATIKHSHHNVDIDKEGKDSWKHRSAGAEISVLLSGNKVSLVREYPAEPSVELISERFIDDVDIILAEGFKGSDLPKIWVFRMENTSSLAKKDECLVAVVSDKEVKVGVPWFDINDVKHLADFIETTFLANLE